MYVKAAIGHELVDQQELVMAMAPSDEFHEVAVPQPANDCYLRDVLFSSLLGASGHSFDGNVKVQLGQKTSVHRPESPFPEFLIV